MSEFSKSVDARELAASGRTLSFEADEAERAAIAARLKLKSIEDFSFTVNLRLEENGHGIWVEGQLEANVVQQCVLTLDPVPAHVEGAFECLYVEGEDKLEALEEDEETWGLVDIDLIGEDGQVDVGELAVQYLSLMLEPYPRAEGAEVQDPVHVGLGLMTEEDAAAARNPFSVLKDLKDKS